MSAPDHDAAVHPLRMYFGVFAALTVVTVVEMLPLFGIWDIPPSILLIMSGLKFLTVCYFFMHLLGDHPVFKQVFFIPLAMMGVTLMVLMTLFDSWTLAYRTTPSGSDSVAVANRYRGSWGEPCNSWVVSAATGNEYCSSPAIGFSTQAAYDALKPNTDADPRLADLDKKSPEEKKAALVAVGQEVYGANCAGCHQANGEGTPGVFPPLKGDPVTVGAPEEHIRVVLKGMSGVAINGVSYAAAMPAWAQLTDEQIAAVVTYERSSWGNDAGLVEPAQVAAAR